MISQTFARRLALICIGISLGSDALAESKPNNAPDTGLERFSWMIGTWKTSTRYNLGTAIPPFESKSNEYIRWGARKEFIVTEEEGAMPDGWHAKIIVTSWNAAEGTYKVVDVDASGAVTQISMTVEGDVVIRTYQAAWGRRNVTIELRTTKVSDIEYTTRGQCRDSTEVWTCYEAISRKKGADGSGKN